ncbi:MAG: NAD(P)H-binding protein [Bacteroidota bacterium]|nr:NAD(P)H-binding protein [Bacteroidota bacterium]
MSERIATIVGATGLIGNYLLLQLIQDDGFDIIRLLVRRPFKNENSKVEVKLIDFNDHESFKLGIDGSNVVFCAVGTTQKKAKGDKEAYRKIDHDIPVNAARFCKETGCDKFLFVSSVGADVKSQNFYLQLKGEVEDEIKKMQLETVSVFRPSILLGDRKESRPGERIGQIAMQTFSFILINNLRRYKPIHAKDVAAAMIFAAKQQKPGFRIYEYDELIKM